ncbi:Similar to carbon monoxide dehydrogenase corrinoid/iron-sulfur protein [Olavius algarvensis associated proteobacterium Delta 3]|nr:Similar to carbon monoxide dehydrogenase corrinoid/iron-sulfur protein [Olavius algarvensis associated proteobacterium Delta 3]CAB5164459.1 Similar to carbon monoxide dehydrogenase corrinoid/iron-sulfur protein [Olavius algarvensis associated proteobacterium Delta 3]
MKPDFPQESLITEDCCATSKPLCEGSPANPGGDAGDPCCGGPPQESFITGNCGATLKSACDCLPADPTGDTDEVCCGGPPPPKTSPYDKPGYRVQRFVAEFIGTAVGPVPRIHSQWGVADRFGTILTRLGVGRHDYRVAPGIYSVGHPDAEAPVVVTANFKLTFDTVRRDLNGRDLWLLVLDTHGINVWCAAGKGTFSTREVISRVNTSGLAHLVQHRKLILPQLCATGVSGRDVKKGCDFEVVWGPIRSKDIVPFLDQGMTADDTMRRVTFSFMERLVLIPVELSYLPKPTLWVLLAAFIISGIGPSIFSIQGALLRGGMAMAAYLVGVIAGAALVPALLPYLPGRAFSVKGAITGVVAGAVVALFFSWHTNGWGMVGLILWSTAISSYLAMNFTGSTPFTSPSGVEKEMRRAIPIQAASALAAVAVWITSGFIA